ISSRILSPSIEILVTCTRSPTRAAGPSSRPISSHFCLSQVPVLSNGSGFFERGRYDLTVAYSDISPRSSSMRSSSVSFFSEADADVSSENAHASATSVEEGEPRQPESRLRHDAWKLVPLRLPAGRRQLVFLEQERLLRLDGGLPKIKEESDNNSRSE